MSTDAIIENLGGFGRFQWMVMMVLFGPMMLMAWSMLMMSFAGTSPDFRCVPLQETSLQADQDNLYNLNNLTSKFCPLDSIARNCSFVYSDDKNTIINEWDLVCDRKTTAASVTAIQMAGVLVGAFFSGLPGDAFGRKPTYFISLFFLCVFNFVAAFSVSWQMFAVMRFFIGTMIGSIFVVSYPYFMEFLTAKWRPLIVVLPFWMIGSSAMALSSWLRPDWSHQHIILASLHVPFLFGWFVAPESLRFLAVKDRLDEAEKVVDLMCRYNRVAKPANTRVLLKSVGEEEKKKSEAGKKYTYLDVYRHWTLCWQTLLIQFVWALMTMVYYGIAFGAAKLSGNLYLNIFLLAVIGVPTYIPSFLLNNKIGRRWTGFLFFFIATVGSFAVVTVTRTVPKEDQGIYINVLAMVTKLGVGAGWGAFQVLSTEIYPTVIRNLGVGAANTSARIGGILAPYIFALEDDDVMIAFIIVGSSMAICGISSLILPETKGKPLAESIKTGSSHDAQKQEKTKDFANGLSDLNGKIHVEKPKLDENEIFKIRL